MRVFSALAFAASVLGLASATPIEPRQEAVRFGIVDVSPSTVRFGQEFTVKYNSTLARFLPQTLSVFVQGTLPNGFTQPFYQLYSEPFTSTDHIVEFNTTLPAVSHTSSDGGYDTTASYLVWAFITFHVDNQTDLAVTFGGTSAALDIVH